MSNSYKMLEPYINNNIYHCNTHYDAGKNCFNDIYKINGLTQSRIKLININSKTIQETPEGKILNELGLKRYCCRRIMLGHIDLIDVI